MRIDNTVVVWAAPATGEAIRADGLGAPELLEVVEDEGTFWEQTPPRRNCRLYLLEVERTIAASPGLLAYLASRPSAWPPFVAFGTDRDLVRAAGFEPNSRHVADDLSSLMEHLRAAVAYWVRHNEPMEML